MSGPEPMSKIGSREAQKVFQRDINCKIDLSGYVGEFETTNQKVKVVKVLDECFYKPLNEGERI